MIIRCEYEQMPEEEIQKNKKYAGLDNPLWGYNFTNQIVSEKADENGICKVYRVRDTLFREEFEDLKNIPEYLITYEEAKELSETRDPAGEFMVRTFSMTTKKVFDNISKMGDDWGEDDFDD